MLVHIVYFFITGLLTVDRTIQLQHGIDDATYCSVLSVQIGSTLCRMTTEEIAGSLFSALMLILLNSKD